jgi:hypothetical protein
VPRDQAESHHPPIRVLSPHPRHRLTRVNQRTLSRDVNSVIEPAVDVAADIAAINRGEAECHGETFIIDGRRYGVEQSGRAFPIDCPGIHQLDRGGFKALGVYNRFGLSAKSEWILDRMDIEPAARDMAQRAWRAGQRLE